jgi:hypothetical protein
MSGPGAGGRKGRTGQQGWPGGGEPWEMRPQRVARVGGCARRRADVGKDGNEGGEGRADQTQNPIDTASPAVTPPNSPG